MGRKSLIVLVVTIGLCLAGCGKNVDENEWKSAYIPIVEQWDSLHGNDYDYGYELIYIDDSDIPELVLACTDEAWTAYDIYTVVDGNAVRLVYEDESNNQKTSDFVSPGCQGKSDTYIERSGVYIQGSGMMGVFTEKSYVLDGNVLKEDTHQSVFLNRKEINCMMDYKTIRNSLESP